MSVCRAGVKILVPLDGSEHSERALKTAVQMAKKFNGKITLLHVLTPLRGFHTPIREEDFFPAAEEAISKAGADLLADAEKEVKAEGVQVETLLKSGHAVSEILKTCEEGDFDLIVMGARGISRVEEMLLGSVSHGVIRHTRLPVLVVR
jgi:nucleotide-binding universal stress UspA family protein